MQDAIYNQIQMAQNVANTPFQPYSAPTVAELSPLQQRAYSDVVANQGKGQAELASAQAGARALASGPGGAAAAKPYYTQAINTSGLDVGSPYLVGAAEQAYEAGNTGTSGALKQLQQAYSSPTLGQPSLQGGQAAFGAAGRVADQSGNYLSEAAGLSGSRAASPYLGQASQAIQQASAGSALGAADPYLSAAGRTATSDIGSYMNPYTQQVTDQIAKLGARNLTENLLPGVSDAFIRSGSFGGSRMGEFGSRALRDTQESILNQQAAALQQGYGQALTASQADLARQGQLASTAGGLSTSDLARTMQGASQYANLGQTSGQLTAQEQANLTNIGQTTGQLSAQQMQNLTNLGQAQTAAGQGQQQFGLSTAQAAQGSQASDLARQLSAAQAQAGVGSTLGALTQAQQQALLTAGTQTGALTGADQARQASALSQVAGMAQQGQAMRAADVAALEGAGAAQQGQAQQQLNAAQQQYNAEQLYPKQQLDWLSTQVRGMAPITPTSTTSSGTSTGATYSASPLSQLATGLYTYKGLQGLG